MIACGPARFVQSIHGPIRKATSVKQISFCVIVVLALPYWQGPSFNTMTYLCLHEHVADCMCGHIDNVRIFFLERNHKSGYLREYDCF